MEDDVAQVTCLLSSAIKFGYRQQKMISNDHL